MAEQKSGQNRGCTEAVEEQVGGAGLVSGGVGEVLKIKTDKM